MTTEKREVTDDLFALAADAEAGIAPASELNVGDVVNRPNAEDIDSLPMSFIEMRSAGYSWVYDVRTGEPFPVNNNMLRGQLAKLDPDTGNRVFTTRDPGYRPTQGTFKCWLHEESNKVEVVKKIGFEFCPKSNINSEFQAREHTRKKHPQEFAAINDAEQRAEEAEDRRIQRELLERVISNSQPAAAETASDFKAGIGVDRASLPEEAPVSAPVSDTCTECNDVVSAKNKAGLRMAMRHHMKREHPEE